MPPGPLCSGWLTGVGGDEEVGVLSDVLGCPATFFDGVDEHLDGVVEEHGLFEVHGMAGLGEDEEARGGDVALHEEGGLDAGGVFVADHDDGGYG